MEQDLINLLQNTTSYGLWALVVFFLIRPFVPLLVDWIKAKLAHGDAAGGGYIVNKLETLEKNHIEHLKQDIQTVKNRHEREYNQLSARQAEFENRLNQIQSDVSYIKGRLNGQHYQD